MRCYILISTAVVLLNGAYKSNGSKIVGGQNTTIEEHPYQVALQFEVMDVKTGQPRFLHVCGGSILNNVTVLTAAHCMVPYVMSVRAGTTFRSSGGKVINIRSYKNHPKYSGGDYDVSVIKLKEAFEFGPTIQAIKIQPIDPIVKDETAANVTGWGRLKQGGSGSKILQKVEVKKVNHEQCQRSYLEENRKVTDRMTCYGDYGKDACQEDSGGPLVAEKLQVGIVSWGIGCAHEDYPGVYADVQNKEIHEFIVSQL